MHFAQPCELRDSHGSRLYRWEESVGSRKIGRFVSEQEIVTFVNKVYEFFSYKAPRIEISARWTQSCWFLFDVRMIRLSPEWGFDIGVILHEICHDLTTKMIVPEKGSENVSWHGPEFFGMLVEMLSVFLPHKADKFARKAKNLKLHMTPPPTKFMKVLDAMRRSRNKGWLKHRTKVNIVCI